MRFLVLFICLMTLFAPQSSADIRDRKDVCEVIGEAIKRVNSNHILIKISSEKVALDQIGDNSCRTYGFPYQQVLRVPEGYDQIKPGDRIHALMSVRIKGKFRTYVIVKNLRK